VAVYHLGKNLVKTMTAILVAEDDPVICDLLTDVLRDEFAATVRCEHTGILALRAIEQQASISQLSM
jgi:CheY-like chemotaxis protein